MGRAKARVLPDPVWATPITSCPSRMAGMQLVWMGVGLPKPVRRNQKATCYKLKHNVCALK